MVENSNNIIKNIKPKKVTLQDIADKVCCSKSLVSLALSGSDIVNNTTSSEIILAALELGYNLNKRKIRQTNKPLISLVLNDMTFLNTFFWSEVVKYIQYYLIKKNIGLDLVVYNDNTVAKDFLYEIINKKTQGFIVVASGDEKVLTTLRKAMLPIVIIDAKQNCGLEFDQITASNYRSSYYCAEYLKKMGHKKIAFVGSINYSLSFRQRYEGFYDGIKNHEEENILYSITEDGDLKESAFSVNSFIKMMKSKNSPTAIFTANDYIAYQIHDLLDKMGLKVPEDISIVGFDNIEYPDTFSKDLTTFNIPRDQIAKVTVDTLFERIKQPNNIKKIIEIVSPLIERKSVKKLQTEE